MDKNISVSSSIGESNCLLSSRFAGSSPVWRASNRTDGHTPRTTVPSISDRNDEVRYINEYGPHASGRSFIWHIYGSVAEMD